MKVGVPREIKTKEARVALVPAGVEALIQAGHEVWVERGAGEGSGWMDEDYVSAGGQVVGTADEVWGVADLIVKVKEPVPVEWPRLRPGQILFTYLHLAASEPLTRALLDSGAVALAYETVEGERGELPLLTPMSEVAGRLAVLEGARYLHRIHGGRGTLLPGVPGVAPGKVVILGGGVVGSNAAWMAAGLGAQVTLLDLSLPRLRALSEVLPPNVVLLHASAHAIRESLRGCDLLIGAVLLPGKRAPALVRRADLALLPTGAVIVDVAVDQGGCVETIRPTTHEDPVYLVDGVVHYGVSNMPGAVARSSTLALTNATLPFILKLANLGWKEACRQDPQLLRGLNVVGGDVVHAGVAEAFGWSSRAPEAVVFG
jgi:alanine dehydrogenase